MNNKGQTSGGLTAFVIFAIVCGGFILYFLYAPLETVRLTAIADPANQSNPLLMLVLYGLQPILWGIWFVVSATAVVGASR